MAAFALAELVLHLAGALPGLLQAAHRPRVLAPPEADVAQVEVGPIHVLQELVLPVGQEVDLLTNSAVHNSTRIEDNGIKTFRIFEGST